jgi:hypothetical protein
MCTFYSKKCGIGCVLSTKEFNIPLSVAECFLKIFSTEKRVVLINISYFL